MDCTELIIKVTGYRLMAVRLNNGELWKRFNLEKKTGREESRASAGVVFYLQVSLVSPMINPEASEKFFRLKGGREGERRFVRRLPLS